MYHLYQLSDLSTVMALLLLCLFLFTNSNCAQFEFIRSVDCLGLSETGECNEWKEETKLYQLDIFFAFCFPADTYVLSTNGPVYMRDLQVGDEIFAYNSQSGKKQFSKVKAWLHRDVYSLLKYKRISIQNSDIAFVSSDYHNIGFTNLTHSGFKFLKDLQHGDSLISVTENGDPLIVDQLREQVEKEGLFSPVTDTGTFYIYPEGFQSQSEDGEMILVHSLSQINNPQSHFPMVNGLIDMSSHFLSPYQPSDDEEYVHPLLKLFNSWAFGSDWQKAQGRKLKHLHGGHGGDDGHYRKQAIANIFTFNSLFNDVLH